MDSGENYKFDLEKRLKDLQILKSQWLAVFMVFWAQIFNFALDNNSESTTGF